MAKKKLRIATRQSPLALWQANAVKKHLLGYHPTLSIELLPLITQGDKHLNEPLTKLGGKGLFVKELENALLSKRADIAVHSMKDVPMECASGLCIAVICQREDARDVLLTEKAKSLMQLTAGACVGTSSLRRQSQLLALRPDLQVKTLRGNVGTRLIKLKHDQYDAILLAAAGLIRLEQTKNITEYLDPAIFLPAPGQGALGVECRIDAIEIKKIIECLNHSETSQCVSAERALSRELGGNCQLPLAAYAECIDQQLYLRALVASPDGKQIIRTEQKAKFEEANSLGHKVAKELLSKGANTILQSLL